VNVAALPGKVSGLVKQWLGETRTFSSEQDKKSLEKVHVIVTPGGAGIERLRGQYGVFIGNFYFPSIPKMF